MSKRRLTNNAPGPCRQQPLRRCLVSGLANGRLSTGRPYPSNRNLGRSPTYTDPIRRGLTREEKDEKNRRARERRAEQRLRKLANQNAAKWHAEQRAEAERQRLAAQADPPPVPDIVEDATGRGDRPFAADGSILASYLHPWVRNGAVKHWNRGDHRIAVKAAAHNIVRGTQRKLRRRDLAGAKLFTSAFAASDPEPNEPRLRLIANGRPVIWSKQREAVRSAQEVFRNLRDPSYDTTRLLFDLNSLAKMVESSRRRAVRTEHQ